MAAIQPLGDFVLTKPMDDTGGLSPGGIYLPDGTGGLGDLIRAEVVAVGPLNYETREKLNIQANVGDEVLFSKHGGMKLKIDGDDYILVAMGMLIAKII